MDEPPVELFVSGRLCLFGEHSDWAGEYRLHNHEIPEGRTLVVGTQQGLHARASKLDRKVLAVTTIAHDGKRHGPIELPLDARHLLAVAQKGGFWSYIAGTAYRIVVSHEVGGLQIDNYLTTLPMSKGLSSSAAVCVLIARAFNRVYDLRLTLRGEMELAYLGEITTPSKCGRMDQACAYGSTPVVMTFDADILHTDTVQLQRDLHLVLVDLNASKDTTTILQSLQAAYPRPATEEQRRLHDLLGHTNQRFVQRALVAMEDGNIEALGNLMCGAQSEFDRCAGPVCPSQLTAPVLHKVLSYAPIQHLVVGGKGVGSQGDGTAQLLCKGPEAQAEVCEIIHRELLMQCLPLTISATVDATRNAPVAISGVENGLGTPSPRVSVGAPQPAAAQVELIQASEELRAKVRELAQAHEKLEAALLKAQPH